MPRSVIKVCCHCKNELQGAEGGAGALAFGDSFGPTWSNFLLGDLYNASSDQSKGDSEFELYLAEVVQVDPSFDPLDWWKQYCNKYAQVAALARRYLPIPQTSVASERLFSLSGHVVTKTRNRLLPDTASAIVFLNKNMYTFDK